MFRRSVLAIATAAVLAVPATAAADPLQSVKDCQKSLNASVAALLWGEWQSPECR